MTTTLPVPSSDPTDLLFNAQKLDEVVSGPEQYYTDRLGANHRTMAGINASANIVLGGIGYAPPVAYAAGISMTLTTQTVEYSGEVYSPKVANLPFTTSTWATDSAKFRLIQGVASADLAASGGSAMIGYMPAGTGAVATTVQAKLSNTVSVKDFGAKGDGSTDDTSAFQAAIDYVSSAFGGGCVYVPAGQYIVTQVKLKTHISLVGDGWGSRITLKSGTNGNLIVLDNVNVEWTRLSNLMIDGNRYNNSSGDAIYYDNTGGTFTFFDANHIIENILIYTAAGAGLSLSANCRESKVVNVFCTGANGDAFYINATDSVFVNCTTGAAGLHGWKCMGPNNRYTNCKAYGSGRLVAAGGNNGAGFYVSQPRQVFTACESQDNGWHGFVFYQSSNSIINGCIADSNGNVTTSSGIRIDQSDWCMISAECLNRDTFTYQKYAIEFASGATNNIVTLLSRNNATGDVSGTIGTNVVSVNNKVRLNNSISIGRELSPWAPNMRALQMQSPTSNGNSFGLASIGYNDTGYVFRNAYYDGTNWKRVYDGFANNIVVAEDGSFIFQKASYGTANTNITWLDVGTIDANGNWILNTNTSAPSLSVNQQMTFALTSNTNLRISVRGTDGVTRSSNLTLS